MSFNQKHPEIKEGEVFLTNGTVREFHGIKCESKRLGNQAYDTKGEMITRLGLRPIFKKEGDEHEYLNNGIVDNEPFR